ERKDADVRLARDVASPFWAHEIPEVRLGRRGHQGGSLDAERTGGPRALGNELLTRDQANECHHDAQATGHREQRSRANNDASAFSVHPRDAANKHTGDMRRGPTEDRLE